jgi:N-acetylmuramoyl-L-alanine amidase
MAFGRFFARDDRGTRPPALFIGCGGLFRLVFFLVFALITFGRAAAADALVVGAVTISAPGRSTVVLADLSAVAPLSVFATDRPARLVVDLPKARFDLPRDATRSKAGAVTAWRWGEIGAGRVRLVFDLDRPMRLAAADLVAPVSGGPARLVVELAPPTDDEPAETRRIHLGGAAPIAPAPAAATGRPVIVVDPGHGGLDAGTVSPATGMPEKTVVLEMSRALVARLKAEGRYEVSTTRDSDVFVGLAERARIARSRHADLFLSIHADAEYDHSVRGATVYTLSEKASDERAAALALKENQSDAIAGLAPEEPPDAVAGILGDLTLRETRRFSLRFAQALLDEVKRAGRAVRGEPHREAALKVLRAPDVPAVLIEIGFLSNKEDEALMTSPEWRDRWARSLAAAIDRYFVETGRIPKSTTDAAAHHPAGDTVAKPFGAQASP